ncbi:hypothetical protein [Saccharomonospora xinjiangensis]|uniref:Uncharacterized protein n=1 Tax=Saccharomonospora xinjiangensis XJ-54 TaxID=882086 RepID=I0V5U2_9PSEU|nr:hypothetical protein [Saccharomonospora xinjiangensis]EID55495.1 hypothetical protein SacxiDRAFT_3290 [Saccharomonospora xinjiangensis XJ-54]
MSDTEEPDHPKTPHEDAGDGAGEPPPTVVVGLLCDPGLPSDVVNAFVGDLEHDLSEHVSGAVTWEVRMRTESLRIDEDGTVPIVRLAQVLRPELGWDLLLCVTDLPRQLSTTPVVADISVRHGVALASLPALGVVGVKRRMRDTVLYLAGELGRGIVGGRAGRERRRAGGKFTPVAWVDRPDAAIEVSLVLVGLWGRLRLLAGMVWDNKPWRLVPELSTALAAGVAAAAFGIFYSSIWLLADALSVRRLALVSLLAIAAMVAWLIAYNRLWESSGSAPESPRTKVVLYNLSSVVSLTVGVASWYLMLFVVTFAGAFAVIENGYLERTLGHPVNLGDYLTLAWLASSMGTFAGALGSSLESEDAVYRAAYSRRERQRRRRTRQAREAEEAPGNDEA